MRVPFFFDPINYAFVNDHCPEQDPVIPFVCVLDAFHAVLHEHCGPCVLEDIRLVKGIILPNFNGYQTEILIDQDHQIITLMGADDVVHYKASFSSSIPDPLERKQIDGKKIPPDYDFLFHGPMLHSIASITTDHPDQNAMAELLSASAMSWQKNQWSFDPFICDGALQMACQLAFMVKQKASLPSKIKKAVSYHPDKKISGHAFADLSFTKISPLHYVFDVYIYDQNNQPLYALEGVESYFRLQKAKQTGPQ